MRMVCHNYENLEHLPADQHDLRIGRRPLDPLFDTTVLIIDPVVLTPADIQGLIFIISLHLCSISCKPVCVAIAESRR
jgi:hypothetical protein